MTVFLVVSYVIALAVVILLVAAYRLSIGEHVECSFNDSVGPCGYWSWLGSTVFSVVFLIVTLVTIFPIVLAFRMIRHELRTRKRTS